MQTKSDMRIDFTDKTVSYRTFLRDLSANIVKMLHEDKNDPDFMSTRQAYKMFGRKNVERWRRAGKIQHVYALARWNMRLRNYGCFNVRNKTILNKIFTSNNKKL